MVWFIAEVRRQYCNPYPITWSTMQILAAFSQNAKWTFNVIYFGWQAQWVSGFHSQLHCQRIGTDVHHTPTFTSKWWRQFVENRASHFSKDCSEQCFFIQLVCIWGDGGQWSLGPSQFFHIKNPDCYTYMDYGSKNNTRGLAYLRKENNCVHCYSALDKAPQCLVVDFYLSKLPLA